MEGICLSAGNSSGGDLLSGASQKKFLQGGEYRRRKIFATARGWEDLSRLIQVYEILGKTVDREVVSQYIQHRMIAKDFAGYLALYYKYRTDYKVEDILKGKWDPLLWVRSAQPLWTSI